MLERSRRVELLDYPRECRSTGMMEDDSADRRLGAWNGLGVSAYDRGAVPLSLPGPDIIHAGRDPQRMELRGFQG
ncbi:MAG TPA: hypothetical protein VFA23_14180 [Dongiaceae bacterium]|nr:hypothetical protein [Dongiaceae bacterium]